MGRLISLRPIAGVLIAISLMLVGCGGPTPVISPGASGPAPSQVVGPPPSAVVPPLSLPPGVTPSPVTPGESPIGPAPTPFNGSTWQPLGDFPFAGAFEVTSVTATPGGYAAVGFGAAPGESYFGRRQGIFWTSADGRSWQPTADGAFQFVTPEEIVALNDSLYVFGTIETCGLEAPDDCVEVPESGWAVWRSTGGGAWERLPQFAAIQTAALDGVIAAHGGFLAFGWAGDEALPTIWTSADGVTWNSTVALAEMDPVTAVSESPAGLVAFGTQFSDEIDDLQLIAAFSSDGVAFGTVQAPDLPGSTVQSLASGEYGLVGVGESTDPDLNFTGLAVYSADGLSWTQASAADGSFDGSDILGVHSVPGGYLALGLIPDIEEFGINSGQSWSSADGLSWLALAPFGESFSRISSTAAGSSGVIAFTVQEEGFEEEETVTSTPEAWLLAP